MVEKPFFTHFADRRRGFLHCEIRGWYWFSVLTLRILGLSCTLGLLLSLLPRKKNDRRLYQRSIYTAIFTSQTAGFRKTHHLSNDYFSQAQCFMKMEKKQCTQCRQLLSLEYFRISKRTTQLTKCCVKCLDACKKSRQQTKCRHGR